MKSRDVLVFLAALLVAAPAWAGLVFEQNDIVLEAGLFDEKSEGVFRFTNTGPEPVTITDAVSSCGCTVPKLEKKVYEPGESGEIRALFTFGSRTGTQQKRITVRTAAPDSATHALTLTTRIPVWFTIQPPLLRWPLNGPATPQQVRVTLSAEADIRLESASEDLKFFSIQRDDSVPGVYIFTITPKNMAERSTEYFRLTASATMDAATRQRVFGVYFMVR